MCIFVEGREFFHRLSLPAILKPKTMENFIEVNGNKYEAFVRPRIEDDGSENFTVFVENEDHRVVFSYWLENMELIPVPQNRERTDISNELFEALNYEVIGYVKANWSPWQK